MSEIERVANGRPEWLIGRETHAEMLPRIRRENAAWRARYGPNLKRLDEKRELRRAAILTAIGRIENEKDRALLMEAFA